MDQLLRRWIGFSASFAALFRRAALAIETMNFTISLFVVAATTWSGWVLDSGWITGYAEVIPVNPTAPLLPYCHSPTIARTLCAPTESELLHVRFARCEHATTG